MFRKLRSQIIFMGGIYEGYFIKSYICSWHIIRNCVDIFYFTLNIANNLLID